MLLRLQSSPSSLYLLSKILPRYLRTFLSSTMLSSVPTMGISSVHLLPPDRQSLPLVLFAPSIHNPPPLSHPYLAYHRKSPPLLSSIPIFDIPSLLFPPYLCYHRQSLPLTLSVPTNHSPPLSPYLSYYRQCSLLLSSVPTMGNPPLSPPCLF